MRPLSSGARKVRRGRIHALLPVSPQVLVVWWCQRLVHGRAVANAGASGAAARRTRSPTTQRGTVPSAIANPDAPSQVAEKSFPLRNGSNVRVREARSGVAGADPRAWGAYHSHEDVAWRGVAWQRRRRCRHSALQGTRAPPCRMPLFPPSMEHTAWCQLLRRSHAGCRWLVSSRTLQPALPPTPHPSEPSAHGTAARVADAGAAARSSDQREP